MSNLPSGTWLPCPCRNCTSAFNNHVPARPKDAQTRGQSYFLMNVICIMSGNAFQIFTGQPCTDRHSVQAYIAELCISCKKKVVPLAGGFERYTIAPSAVFCSNISSLLMQFLHNSITT